MHLQKGEASVAKNMMIRKPNSRDFFIFCPPFASLRNRIGEIGGQKKAAGEKFSPAALKPSLTLTYVNHP